MCCFIQYIVLYASFCAPYKNGKQATILTFAAVRNEEELIKIPIASGNELSTHAYLFWSKGLYRKKAALHFNRILAQIINKG